MSRDRNRPLARDIMRRDVLVLDANALVVNAINTLIAQRLSSAPVMDQGRLVGIFSDRDALTVLSASLYEAQADSTVAHYMRRDIAVVAGDADILDVASILRDHPLRHLPVLDSENRLIGIITRGDALKALLSLGRDPSIKVTVALGGSASIDARDRLLSAIDKFMDAHGYELEPDTADTPATGLVVK